MPKLGGLTKYLGKLAELEDIFFVSEKTFNLHVVE